MRQGPTLHLAFQGGCGACTLLSRRMCTAYEDRPAHCRYFPFHVYFGRRTEAYVNRSCRGVEPLAPHALTGAVMEGNRADANTAFQAQVLAVAAPTALAEHEREARRVHAEFERKAKAAGVWGDADAALRDAVALPWFTEPPSAERWAEALGPFAEEDVVARPFYLDAGLRWLTFRRDGTRIEVLEMQEDGSLTVEGTELRPTAKAPPQSAAAGLQDVLGRLAARDVMAGQTFDLVDASRYRLTVAKAARHRVAQVAADLAVRVQVLQALGVAEEQLAAEAERFYDAAFLDAPTIGGWL
ncbi:MAG: YkgJ family cysteine cluster protein [Thermoplasmatota archaeon]